MDSAVLKAVLIDRPSFHATTGAAVAHSEAMDAKQELGEELRRARNWILGVGIMMFVIDTIMIQGVYGDRLPSEWKTKFLVIDLVILGVFVGLYVLARSQPKLACVLVL